MHLISHKKSVIYYQFNLQLEEMCAVKLRKAVASTGHVVQLVLLKKVGRHVACVRSLETLRFAVRTNRSATGTQVRGKFVSITR